MRLAFGLILHRFYVSNAMFLLLRVPEPLDVGVRHGVEDVVPS